MATTFNKQSKTSETIVHSSPQAATSTPDAFLDIPTPNQNIASSVDLNERVHQMRQDQTDGEKPYSVGYYDIDEAIGYYFSNVLSPTVVENGELIKVPILYGSPERWSSMNEFGIYRDNKGKIILPLIMYHRTNMSRNENIPILRADQLYYVTKKKWDTKHRYDDFSLKYGNVKKELQTDRYNITLIPNYILISYECIIWTSFLQQMNPIVEKIQFSDTTYWGDKDKFKFRAQIDSMDSAVELAIDTERMVKTTFTVTIYGYILPQEFNNLSTTNIGLMPRKISFAEYGDMVKGIFVAPDNYFYDAEVNLNNLDFSSTFEKDLNG